jgi:hypothetical protein
MKVYYSNLCVGPQFIRAPLSVTGGSPVKATQDIQTFFSSVSFNRPELEGASDLGISSSMHRSRSNACTLPFLLLQAMLILRQFLLDEVCNISGGECGRE